MLNKEILSKLEKLSKEELLELFKEIIDVNEDVLIYLNNKNKNKKLNYQKEYTKLLRLSTKEGILSYYKLTKNYNDYNTLAELGIDLLDDIINNYNYKFEKDVENIGDLVCKYISYTNNNELKESFLALSYNEIYGEILTDIYYFYFSD